MCQQGKILTKWPFGTKRKRQNVFIVSSLVSGKCAISLESNKCKITWVSDERADGARSERGLSLLLKRQISTIILFLEVLAEVEV